MSIWSKIQEAMICLKAGKSTLPYPARPEPVPENFRGRPIFLPEKCIGCAGCANNCPAREILVQDISQEVRIVKYLGRRCTYCGRCADVCPEKAIVMSKEFQNGTNAIGDIQQEIRVFMGTCQRCGRCFKEPGPMEQLMLKGYRTDDLASDKWIYASKPFLESDAVVRDIEIELD